MDKFTLYFVAVMSVVLCQDVVNGACPEKYENVAGKCYHFFDKEVEGWLQAEGICNTLNGDLAIIDNCYDFGVLVDYIYDHDLEVDQGYWLGGSDYLVDTYWEWQDGTSMTMGAPYWGRSSDQPAEPSGSTLENCAHMASGDGYYLHDENCEESTGMAPMCQIRTFSGSCPANYILIAGRCFQFLPQLDENWEDARVICSASGGDLAKLDDCGQMEAVIHYILANGTNASVGYWIGATDAAQEGAWRWSVDGTSVPMGVPFWGREGTGTLKPDISIAKNCLEMSAHDHYYFSDVECVVPQGRMPLCQTSPI